MKRRTFIKSGMAALAQLKLGEYIYLGVGTAVGAGGVAAALAMDPPPRKTKHDYSQAKRVKSVCLNCSTVCGIEGFVIDNQVVKIRGNPLDPNMGSYMTCAKGQSGPTINDYPERLLYPLKRAGARGEGLWQRISWDEAYTEIASRIQRSIDAGHPERVALHAGRSRIDAEIKRFLGAIGSPVQLNHRALCSASKRGANYISLGDTDWESIDAERCRYFLNFGSNFYEAHQGGLHLAKRVATARFDHGAKLVTFDVRLSNTAGRSDEWHAPFPGTEGAIALAMGHVIMREGEYDRRFMEHFVNLDIDKVHDFLAPYTPEWAAQQSGIVASDIERLALEFARQRPAAVAFTNRGTGAHYNGLNAERAVVMLNALVGAVGQPGGYCYGLEEKLSATRYLQPQPVPPKPKLRTDLEDPPEWPLANRWQEMKVGQIVYDYIRQGRAKVDVYLSYTISSPMTWPEGRSTTVEVLKDESLIPFHACSDVVYSEMAHYADLILPDATYLERWGLDTRNSLELQHFVTLRQPMVQPPGEARSYADVLFDIGRRLGPEQARYFQFGDHEAFVRHQCANIPAGEEADGFEYMKKHGVYVDRSAPKSYEVHRRRLTPEQLRNTRVDEATQVIYTANTAGQESAIGLMIKEDGIRTAVRGFQTPSRKFELYCPELVKVATTLGITDDGLPSYIPIPAHQNLPEDRFILTSFKWNVHTQARTANQKYLTEIVHDNPMWINASTAASLGLKTGDWVELTTYRPVSGPHGDQAYRGTGEPVGSERVRIFVTQGIHPRVFAVSNSLGYLVSGRAALARQGKRNTEATLGQQGYGGTPEQDDLSTSLWWDERQGGRGNGYNVNRIIPINPQPLIGNQAWFDTVCTIRKVEGREA
ncbi:MULTISPECIES: molybdopterin-dependent oxidoreductase [unclassified Pseudomonas]|uniref:molybdopterin-containing oxidoreductase family protein n=1 Tax=unclassified Pseudomonas TaxID=196821 RepID=UPI00257CBCBE|nr:MULTISPECIES: molybdopterin-dependent oxidoreductase [unclassified Pseudomonas]